MHAKCRDCGHTWSIYHDEPPDECPYCGYSPYEDDEEEEEE